MAAAARVFRSVLLVLAAVASAVLAGAFTSDNPASAVAVGHESYVPAIDPAQGATYTMTASPANPVPPGQPVVATLTAADQQANPLAGVRVVFSRHSDPARETSVFTDSAGDAVYQFEPALTCGEDWITAVVHDSVSYDGDPADDAAVFTTSIVVSPSQDGACGDAWLPVTLTGKSSFDRHGNPLDVLRVSATAPDSTPSGAPVTLKAKIDGDWVQAGRTDRVLDARGKVTIFIRDRSPRRSTSYQAFVGATAISASGHSSIYRQR